MSEQLWLNTAQAAERAGVHVETLLVALQAEELHGGQRKKGGRWRIHRDCVDAWALHEPCPHEPGSHLRAVSA
jgi:excisionase family DNA binding protein